MLLFSHPVMSNSLLPHGLQHTRRPCPSPFPGVCSSSCSLSWWCHATISSSVIPFSCFQFFRASESFPMSPLFASGSRSIGDSAWARVCPVNIQDWFPLGLTGSISLQSKGLSRVFSSATSSKVSILRFMVQLLQSHMTTGETIALTIQPWVVSKYACINWPYTEHFREVFARCWGSLCAAVCLLVLGPVNFTCFGSFHSI